MSRTHRFARDLCKMLNGTQKSPRWQTEWKPPGSKPGLTREAVDVGAQRAKVGAGPALIEVELRRAYPASNVVKVWKWLNGGKVRGRLILIQAFSAFYAHPAKKTQRQNAEFLGRQMESANKGRVRYIPIRFAYRPQR